MEKILLVEPEYKNKYPPIGLMKLASYHRNKGDHVDFYKGEAPYNLITKVDRIYVTTLFTFHYEVTKKCILHYKKYKNINSIFVGGIAATLLPRKFLKDTGIKNIIQGQLLNSGMIGYEDNVNIDALPLDYDILDDVLYEYPAKDNYFIYTTRGCPRGCKFCAVRILEPKFETTNNVISQVSRVDAVYGQKRNMLVMDNNILCSPKLPSIVEDIYALGFTGEANYTYPNKFIFTMAKIQRRQKYGLDISRQLSQTIEELDKFSNRLKNFQKIFNQYQGVLEEIKKSENILNSLKFHEKYISEIYEKYRIKTKMIRYVDFNQGIDARLINSHTAGVLSKIPISPFRLAYDNVDDTKIFLKSTRVAFNKGFRKFSNYMLYNWEDNPEDLWFRLNKAVGLYNRLGKDITGFSFPMKYAPIDEIDRSFIGKHWNKKYLNAINVIINVTKGVVAKEKDFFYEAFGKNKKEFLEILLMPDEFIRDRFYFRDNGLYTEWKKLSRSLAESEKSYLLDILCQDNYAQLPLAKDCPVKVKKILILYRLNKNQFDKHEKSFNTVMSEINSL